MDSSNQDTDEPASTLALALIFSSQAPLVLLDGGLEVIAASASFYGSFNLALPLPGHNRFADLGHGEWNVPQLLLLLRATAAGNLPIEAYEMDLVRPDLPVRRLVLSAHKLDYHGSADTIRVILAVTDVTAAREADALNDALLREKQLLMQELQHRVANSLQIIASVLLQSARGVNSEETRSRLHDAHHRVMSVATLQKQLATTQYGAVHLRRYFTDLCDSITASMIPESGNLRLTAMADDSTLDAHISASLGLIVTELVINSLKHAFPGSHRAGTILVDFRSAGTGWILQVKDDGIGFPHDGAVIRPGLGTGIVEALARQLDASVTIHHDHPGTSVSIVHD